MALGLDGHDREQLLAWRAQVDALRRTHPLGHPEESLEAQDVVDAEQAGDVEVVLERLAHLTVAVGPRRLGEQRGEAPLLAAGEEVVRWCTHRHAWCVLLLVAPHVVAERMGAERQVERQHLASTLEALRHARQLLMRKPLEEGLESGLLLGDVTGPQHTVAHVRRPAPPVPSHEGADGHEASVVQHLRPPLEEAAEVQCGAVAPVPELIEDAPQRESLCLESSLGIDRLLRGGEPCPSTLALEEAREPLVRDRGSCTIDVDPPLVPEAPAHRTIGAGLEVGAAEAREQRKGRDDRDPLVGCKATELVEIAQVTSAPAVRGVEGEERRADAEGPPALAEAAPRAPWRLCQEPRDRSAAT